MIVPYFLRGTLSSMTGRAEDTAGRPDDIEFTASGSDREMAVLYAEFAEEDRALAEAGMSDYTAGLAAEDDTWCIRWNT